MPRVAAVGRVAVAGRVAIPQTTNLLVHNRDLAGADWVSINEAGAGGFADPLGGTQAYELSETAAVGFHSRFSNGSNPTPISAEVGNRPGQWLCASAFLRPGARTFGGFILDMGTTQIVPLWNLSTGAATSVGASGDLQQILQSSQAFGDGWRRYFCCFYNVPGIPAGGFVVQCCASTDGTTTSYLGVVGSTIRIFSPAVSAANRPGPVTDTTAATILTRIRNEVRGRVAP